MSILQETGWKVEIPKSWGRAVSLAWHGPNPVVLLEADDGTLRVVELGSRPQVVERAMRV